jgi:hypothetical protein
MLVPIKPDVPGGPGKTNTEEQICFICFGRL